MFPLGDNLYIKSKPIITRTLVALNILIYLWDRQWHLLGPSVTFADLGMRPSEIIAALTGHGDKSALLTLYTCLFLHGNLMHIFGNMIVLWALGGAVEAALGSIRYAILYLVWGLIASITFIALNSSSMVSTLGASGAIAGMLGCYLILFPKSKLIMIIPPFFLIPFPISAWIFLGMWFLLQVFLPQPGVASWAHVGGFIAGMLTILIMGGPQKIFAKLKKRAIDIGNENEEIWDQ